MLLVEREFDEFLKRAYRMAYDITSIMNIIVIYSFYHNNIKFGVKAYMGLKRPFTTHL